MKPALLALVLTIFAQQTPKDLPPDQWPLQERINAAVERGVERLKAQVPADGLFRSQFGTAGPSALALYTLAVSGVPASDPAVARLAEALRKLPMAEGTAQQLVAGDPAMRMTYSHALAVLAFATLDPEEYKREIKRSVQVLARAQKSTGQWAYIISMGGPLDAGDNSNTQFALLALRVAELRGFSVPASVWSRSYGHFKKTLDAKSGGWGYGCPGSLEGVYGSMTAVGVASLVISKAMMLEPRKRPTHQYLREPEIARGMIWLEDQFAADHHPWIDRVRMGALPGGPDGRPGGGGPGPVGAGAIPRRAFMYYWLYSVERVGMLLSRKYIGAHDWYREGAEWLLAEQRPDGSWSNAEGSMMAPEPPLAATCFALLFLKRATLPVVTPEPEVEEPK